MTQYPAKEKYDAEDLAAIISLLRDPVSGCPWDKVQTHTSIRQNFLEETYEVLEAIDREDATLLCEELGDVLMQVALHSRMEEEKGGFSFSDVCDGVCRKLIFRHPHIFSGAAAQSDGLNDWDALKNREKGRQSLADELDSVPVTLPALMKAQKTQKRAEPYGTVTADSAEAYQALKTAENTLKAALAASKASSAPGAPAQNPPAEAQAGAYLFAAANWLRTEGLDAEEALEQETKRFHAAHGGEL
ncbi:MAG: MazG family protein [Faecalibacterium sp.]|jgi:tetrapyrrole methylase family protein/MazG family protein|nr:MazG family protein [Faecalibacterium sp.]